jgi:hypothetical protein
MLARASLSLILVTAACGAGVRYQAIGTGRTVVAGTAVAVGGPPGGPVARPSPVGSSPDGSPTRDGAGATAGMTAAVPLPPDARDSTYRVDYDVWLPQAAEVDWMIRCGAVEQRGVLGEDFAVYRERRIMELTAQREQARRNAAAIGSAIGGAVLGQVGATATAQTPVGEATATVVADGSAIGAAAGASTVSTDAIELAPGDLGARNHHGRATLLVADANAGACTMELAPRGALAGDVVGTFAVSRKDDSAHWEAVRARDAAVVVRGDLRAQLVARGGDVNARAQAAAASVALDAAAAIELDARARALDAREAQAAAEARRLAAMELERVRAVRLELTASLVARGGERGRRLRLEGEAWAYAEWVGGQCRGTRRSVHEQLVARGADPGWRERQAALELEARLRLDAQLMAQHAADEAAWQRTQVAISDARSQVVAHLTSRGGVVRGPMPEPIAEMYGEPPLPGYTWEDGFWEWRDAAWRWTPGYWLGHGVAGSTTTTVVVAGPPVPVPVPVATPVGIGVSVGISIGAQATPPPAPPAPPPPHYQDHRKPAPPPPPPPHYQDHR